MRDFLPEEVRRREYVIGIVKRVYERYGFEPLETPAVENIETLLGKYGEEGNQLIYKILKRGEGEATGQADLALRYDLTVPLARVVAHHQARLPKLFKRYQIQPVWRADRPARGRFREFYQCDVDALGSTSPLVEAELCAALSEVLVELGFSDFVIRLNDRQLLTRVLNASGVDPVLHSDALIALDKLDRVGRDGVSDEFVQRGIPEAAAKKLLLLFSEVLPGLATNIDVDELNVRTLAVLEEKLRGDRHEFAASTSLHEILALVARTSAAHRVRLDLSLARGLSYYTGAIMEIALTAGDFAGSVGGGGRYDNLVGMFLGQSIPACGFSLGLERILVVMGERGMFPASLATTSADVMVSCFDAAGFPHAMEAASVMRQAGLRVLVYPDADKIGKQIKYADGRGIPFVALLGADEIAHGTITVKDLARQTQTTYDRADAGAAIRKALTERG